MDEASVGEPGQDSSWSALRITQIEEAMSEHILLFMHIELYNYNIYIYIYMYVCMLDRYIYIYIYMMYASLCEPTAWLVTGVAEWCLLRFEMFLLGR